MKKLFSFVLVFILLFGISVPVNATQEIPSSFDFSSNFRFALKPVEAVLDNCPEEIMAILGGNGITTGVSGTMVTNGLAYSLYVEIDLDMEKIISATPQLAQMSAMFNNAPFRFWIETDLNDLNNPSSIMVIEVPAYLRMALLFVDVNFACQYWVLDLSEQLAEIDFDELEAEFYAYEDEMNEYFIEFMEEFMELWEEAVDFEFSGEITNKNTAVKVALPLLTEANSFDLVAWLMNY